MRPDGGVPGVRRFIEDPAADRGNPRVVDEDVDAAKRVLYLRDRVWQRRTFRHVEMERHRRHADRLQLGQYLAVLLLISSQHGDCRTGARQAKGNGSPNPAVAAGDDRDTTAKVE